MRTIALLLSAGAIAQAAPPVGPWLTYDIPTQATNWDVTAILPKFDPATLLPDQSFFAVEFIITAEADSVFSYMNTAPLPADVTLELNATVSSSGPLPGGAVALLSNSTSTTVAPGDTISDSLHDDDSAAGSLGGLDLLPFIGVGTVDIPVHAMGQSSVQENTGNGVYSIDTTAAATISIRYIVRDSRGGGEIPEGSVGFAGLALLLLLSRWRR